MFKRSPCSRLKIASRLSIRSAFLGPAVVLAGLGAGAHAADPAAGIAPITDADYHQNGAFAPAKVELGRLLFFDKILSGNRNIACATCHHPRFATGDGVSMPLGEGAMGLGPARRTVPDSPVIDRVPRNSQALFNLGAAQFVRLFHDGRVTADPEHYWGSGFRSPALGALPKGLDNALAAQAMFPVTSDVEMAGHEGENEIADAAALPDLSRFTRVWDLVAARLRAIPAYVELFAAAFPDAGELTFVQAANAIAAFEAAAFRADNSPFDQYLRTRDPAALGPAAVRGMELFYGKADCAGCHAGPFQTDQRFHAIAMPQIGPGKAHGNNNDYWRANGFFVRLEDWGRYDFTKRIEDKFRFRTPSLRNVAITGPWGHAGAYDSLEAVIRHHLNPEAALAAYDPARAALPPIDHAIDNWSYEVIPDAQLAAYRARDDWVHRDDRLRQAIAAANRLPPRDLSDGEIADLLAFLDALTDPASRDLDHLIPDSVPSGLPVDR